MPVDSTDGIDIDLFTEMLETTFIVRQTKISMLMYQLNFKTILLQVKHVIWLVLTFLTQVLGQVIH